MKAVILGATKGIGREMARQMAATGDSLFLLGRDLEDLGKSAADLQARGHQGEVGVALCDLSAPETFKAALDAADEGLQSFDTLIITAGLFGTQEELEQDSDRALELLRVNFAHTVVLCEHARKRLLARGGGRLCVFSSVAGDRGRKPVIIYGASKAGLSAYLEGLDHKFRAEGLMTLCVKPGFVKTGMTAGLKPPPFAGEPEQVAKQVLKALSKKKALVYTPKMWGLVMMVIKRLPRFVMRRIGF